MRRHATSLIAVVLIAIAMAVLLPHNTVHAQLAAGSGFTYTHISGAASTQVATIGMTLHTVTVNTAGTSATLYDNASACSGTVVAVIGAAGIGSLHYDLQLKNGLCITTVGSGDWTVTTR